MVVRLDTKIKNVTDWFSILRVTYSCLLVGMATNRATNFKTNKIYNDSEPDNEFSSEIENEFKSSEISDPDTESKLDISDSENTFSCNNRNKASRLW